VVSVAAAIAVPNLRSARLNANESAAIATLKNISSGQSQCQASGIIDVNGNGSGEYGYFAELAASVALRGKTARMAPAVLSNAFGTVQRSRVHRSGYVFQMFLPDAQERGVAESASGGAPPGVDADNAEVFWCCYAWPQHQGRSGKRTFFINHCGDVLATNGAVRAYDGEDDPVSWQAAFAAEAGQAMSSPVAANTLGQDGNTWVVV